MFMALASLIGALSAHPGPEKSVVVAQPQTSVMSLPPPLVVLERRVREVESSLVSLFREFEHLQGEALVFCERTNQAAGQKVVALSEEERMVRAEKIVELNRRWQMLIDRFKIIRSDYQIVSAQIVFWPAYRIDRRALDLLERCQLGEDLVTRLEKGARMFSLLVTASLANEDMGGLLSETKEANEQLQVFFKILFGRDEKEK